MSGIFGIYYFDHRLVDRADLTRIAERLAHRGPDGANIWCDGSVGLGHRMLWTTPESLYETLPLAREELVITADARIDNREELITALGLEHIPAKKITDSQLILEAYEKWGNCCFEYLLGDFAFAIWDRRKQVLFCARDHFGVKPIYYYHHPGRGFIFGTEIKAILCVPEVPCRLNEVRVGDYLETTFEDKEITFYQDIYRLPPGHCLSVSCQSIQLNQYWFLDPKRELRLRSDEEYAEAFREIFTESVGCRLRSAFPVGSFLSGGLDSSAITCVARELLAQQDNYQLQTFSAVFDKITQCDERPFIQQVLAQGRISPHYVHADQISPLTDIDRVLWHQDEPFYAPNLFMHWGIYSAAQQQGIRILLDGFIGDTTVSHGWPYLIELARNFRWFRLMREVKGATTLQGGSTRKWFKHYVWQYSLKPWIPEQLYRVWRQLKGYRLSPPSLSPIINLEFAERINLLDRIHTFQQQSKLLNSAREYHCQDLLSGANSFALEGTNKAASAFSIEARFPFTDKRLIEFCLAIPPEQKLRNGWIRFVMRRALTNYLPEKIQWRKDKGNLYPNFHHGLTILDRKILEDTLVTHSTGIQQFVHLESLNKTYQKFIQHGLEDYAVHIWVASTLALWLRQQNFNYSGGDASAELKRT